MLTQISDVAEVEVKKLEKKFKEGSHVRVRVLGFKHLEGLATGILKVVLLHSHHFLICRILTKKKSNIRKNIIR